MNLNRAIGCVGGVIWLWSAAHAAGWSFERVAHLTAAADGAERLAFAPGPGFLLSTDPRQQEIHLHRVDWSKPELVEVDAFPPTDASLAIPTPGRPVAVAVHPMQPLALALTRPSDIRARGEVLFLDLREKSAGRLLRAQLVGYQPAHLQISPDGRWAVVANEGDGSRRTPGSIGILDLRNLAGWEVNRLQEIPYRELTGLGALMGQPEGRLEPESVAMHPRGEWAAIAFQENDAVVWVDLRGEEPRLSSLSRLPPGSEPVDLVLLDRPDGLVLAIAEKATQHISFHRVLPGDRSFATTLCSRLDVRPLVHAEKPHKRRDPHRIRLANVGTNLLAWVGSERTDRILMLDVNNPARPRLVARAASAEAPRDLLLVETREGLRVAAGNGQGTITVFRVGASAP